jgi:hypothetical protein
MNKPDDLRQYDAVEVVTDGVSWGRGWIERVYRIGGRLVSYRVIIVKTGLVKICAPNEVRRAAGGEDERV